jgi:hypothetical protein
MSFGQFSSKPARQTVQVIHQSFGRVTLQFSNATTLNIYCLQNGLKEVLDSTRILKLKIYSYQISYIINIYLSNKYE